MEMYSVDNSVSLISICGLEGDHVWAEGQAVNVTAEFLSLSLKTATVILSSAVFPSFHSTQQPRYESQGCL